MVHRVLCMDRHMWAAPPKTSFWLVKHPEGRWKEAKCIGAKLQNIFAEDNFSVFECPR